MRLYVACHYYPPYGSITDPEHRNIIETIRRTILETNAIPVTVSNTFDDYILINVTPEQLKERLVTKLRQVVKQKTTIRITGSGIVIVNYLKQFITRVEMTLLKV